MLQPFVCPWEVNIYHFDVTSIAMLGVPGGESAAGEHLKADSRRPERELVTVDFREFSLSAIRNPALQGFEAIGCFPRLMATRGMCQAVLRLWSAS
jgi:hypothetical protein